MNRKQIFYMMVILLLCVNVFAAAAFPNIQEEMADPLPADAETTDEPAIPDDSEMSDPPSGPVPEYPVDIEMTELVGFYWKPSENADYYEVTWQQAGGFQDSAALDAASGTCQAGQCILFAELPGDGSYSWKVSAVNEAGTADSEESTFTVRIGVPTPEAYRPNTTLNTQRPLTLEWQDVGKSAAEYRVQIAVHDTGEICMDRTFPVEQMWVGNGICYFETDIYLPEGNYSWRVQGVNGSDVSGWSAWVDFQEVCTECQLGTYLNTVTSGVYPNGMITETSPVFEWLAVTGATYYLFNVTDAEGAVLADVSVPAADCTLTTCIYDPGLVLETGKGYTWAVSTYGGYDARWGTYEGTIRVDEPAMVTEGIEFILPAEGGSLDPNVPLILWTDPGESAAAFRLNVRNEAEEPLFYGDFTRDEAWCDGKTCSIVFMEIPEGSGYRIEVTPISEANLAGVPVSLSFTNKPEASE